jgi:hypothetical protein
LGAAVDDVVINATTDLDLGTGFGNTIAASATNTITISGTATTVDLGSATVDADVDTIDASGLTAGGVVYTQTSTTGDFTGGAGNDTVNLGTTALGATSTINAGAGTDTVTFTNSTNFATAAPRTSNFEQLEIEGNGASYDISALTGSTISKITVADGQGGNALTMTNVGANVPITVADSTGNLSIGLADTTGSNAVSLTIDDATATPAAITIADLQVAAVETLNIITADAGVTHVITDLDTSTSVTSIVASGTSALTFTDVSDAASGLVLDGSGMTTVLTVNELDAGDTIKGGSGADVFSTAHTDLGNTTTFQGGAGDDTLNLEGNGSTLADIDFTTMTGIENITIGSATATTVTLSGFAQSAIGTIDNTATNSNGNLDLTATSLTTASTVDASALTLVGIDLTATITPANGGGAVAGTITGSAVGDSITLTLNDTPDANGDDNATATVTPGNGIDTITLTVTAGDAADIITVVNAATSLANSDIIAGATLAATQIDLNASSTAAATEAANATLAGGIAANANAGSYVIQTDIADSAAHGNTSGTAFTALLASTSANLAANYAALEAQLVASGGIFNGTIAGLDAAIASTESEYFVIDNGTGAAVLRFSNTSATGNTVLDSEIDLVALFTDYVLTGPDIA